MQQASQKCRAERCEPGRERGASLVEFALIAPLLLSVLLGTITGGLALATKNSMTNAVREGGRLAATLPEGTDWTADWAIAVKDRVVALSGGDLDDDEVCVQIIDVGPNPDVVKGSYAGASCPGTGAPVTPSSSTKGCVIKVWARTTADLNVLFFSQPLTLDADVLGVYERPAECP